ncbi:MAG: hypothetical protein AABY00_03645 [Nanoarchaeota archaeon]
MTLKLQPSSRIKHRYLLIRATSRAQIEQAILEAIGVLGWAKAAPLFVDDKLAHNQFILAISRESINEIRASFELFKENVKILKVSGTLKGLGK